MRALAVVVFVLLSRAAFAGILDGKHLAQVVLTLPDVKLDHEAAIQLVSIVIEHADTDLDPTVLLAQAYIESRFDPTSVSRLIDGARRTGPWRAAHAPRGWSGNLYCGITQNAARSWSACLALRETRAAIAAQTRELRAWLKRTRGDLPRALAGYGCGNHGVATGRCNRYPQRVLGLAASLRKAMKRPSDGPMS